MSQSMKFGIKSADLKQAGDWVPQVTGLKAEERESSFWGGNYLLFKGTGNERIRVFENKDEYDDEPIIDGALGWEFVVMVESEAENSPILLALEAENSRFKKLEAKDP